MEESENKVYYITDSSDEDVPGGYGDDVYIKIGYTTGDAKDRLNALQTGNPRPLFLLYTEPGGSELENEIHTLCAEYRVRGEWFLYNQGMVDLLWPSVRKRTLDRLDKLKEQSWIDEAEGIKVLKETYEAVRNEIQTQCSVDMYYLIAV